MEKKKLVLRIFAVLILVYAGCSTNRAAAEDNYRVEQYRGHKIVVGEISPDSLLAEIPAWRVVFESYHPNPKVVDELAAIEQDLRIVIVMGVWCPDSRAGVPTFLKVLILAGNPHLKVRLYAVNRKLDDPTHAAQRYDVTHVPTFIIYSGEKEIGRMVEIPEVTFESDLVKLLKKAKK